MARVQFGRTPPAPHVIAHVSDTHLLAGGAPLGGVVDTVAALDRAVAQLRRLGPLTAIVVTGDVADLGEADAYARARGPLEDAASAAGAELVWVMGNHDERPAFRQGLLDLPASGEPVRTVVERDGVRIVAVDTTVPGYHHGELDEGDLDWLADVLARPARHGTVLAMHHAPIPSPVALMDVLELRGQDALEAVLRGSDVRLILGGHLHYPTSSVFAGIPVSVTGSCAYAIDTSAPSDELIGIDGGRVFSTVHLGDATTYTTVVPLGEHPVVSRFPPDFVAELAGATSAERLERFSRKRSG